MDHGYEELMSGATELTGEATALWGHAWCRFDQCNTPSQCSIQLHMTPFEESLSCMIHHQSAWASSKQTTTEIRRRHMTRKASETRCFTSKKTWWRVCSRRHDWILGIRCTYPWTGSRLPSRQCIGR